MAICDYCGTSYRGGALKEGLFRFCTGLCHDRGKVLLGFLKSVREATIDSIIDEAPGAHVKGVVKIMALTSIIPIKSGLRSLIQSGKLRLPSSARNARAKSKLGI